MGKTGGEKSLQGGQLILRKTGQKYRLALKILRGFFCKSNEVQRCPFRPEHGLYGEPGSNLLRLVKPAVAPANFIESGGTETVFQFRHSLIERLPRKNKSCVPAMADNVQQVRPFRLLLGYRAERVRFG